MRGMTIILIVILAVVGFIGLNSFYTVRQDKQAIVLRFGSLNCSSSVVWFNCE